MSLIKNHDIVKRIFRDQYLPISCTRLNISYDSSRFDRRPRHFAMIMIYAVHGNPYSLISSYGCTRHVLLCNFWLNHITSKYIALQYGFDDFMLHAGIENEIWNYDVLSKTSYDGDIDKWLVSAMNLIGAFRSGFYFF